MSNLSMFDSTGPAFPEKRTPKQDRAIQAFLSKGYRLLMRNGPGYNFQDKSTGEEMNVGIDELVTWYEEDKKEERRAKAAEKKQKDSEGRRRFA